VGTGQPGADDLRLELDTDPAENDIEVLEAGLDEFNRSTPLGRDRTKVPVAVWLRHGEQILGGASGDTHYGWLYLSALWVDEGVRGRGWGRRLIRLFEEEGIARGCHGAWVDTYGFQAPVFYERVGYREFGRLDEFPPGSARHFLSKRLP
jgi:GNAT superfamily N-acetyltransferase